jgi:hypothetical protein
MTPTGTDDLYHQTVWSTKIARVLLCYFGTCSYELMHRRAVPALEALDDSLADVG